MLPYGAATPCMHAEHRAVHRGGTGLRLRVAQQALEGCSDDLLVVECERLRGRCHVVPLRLCRIILPAIKQPQRSRARPACIYLSAAVSFTQPGKCWPLH